MYAWTTSVHMQNSPQACTQSRLTACPLNTHTEFVLHAEETCGASGITSAHQQPAVTLRIHILECAICVPEGVCTLKLQVPTVDLNIILI